MTKPMTLAASLALGVAASVAALTGASADETAMAKAAKVSLVQALDAAEAKGMGKATEVDFDDADGGRWEVTVLGAGGDKLTTYNVDPTSGQVTGETDHPIAKYFTMLKPEAFQKASTQLKAAVAAAETAAGGKAINAEVEREGEAVAYEITVATADSTKDVDVDANGVAKMD